MDVTLRDIRFEYPQGDFRLHIPHLKIPSGKKVGVVGPSGSGKTTLLRLIAGIDRPQEGCLQVGDRIINRLSDRERRRFRARHIGFVFQDFRLIEYLNVRDNILLPYRIHPALLPGDDARGRADSIAAELGLARRGTQPVQHLSQGEQQRVAICRGLVIQPDLVLADEPTGNLDPSNKKKIRDLLCAQAEKRGVSLVMVTHDTTLLDGFDQIEDFNTLNQALV